MLSRRVLIIEDDADAAGVLEAYLRRENYDVVITGDGLSGLDMAHRWKPDLILLDVMLPGLNGTEVLAGLRRKNDVPVIMVTAMGDTPDRIGALRYGADDYVVKPYHPGEVVARVQAVLRRSNKTETKEEILRWQSLEVDVTAIVASIVAGNSTPRTLDLTPTEFSLLTTLMRSPSRPFSRQHLLEHCLPESEALERVVDTHIYNLRKKLEAAGISGVLVNVRGVGYRFDNHDKKPLLLPVALDLRTYISAGHRKRNCHSDLYVATLCGAELLDHGQNAGIGPTRVSCAQPEPAGGPGALPSNRRYLVGVELFNTLHRLGGLGHRGVTGPGHDPFYCGDGVEICQATGAAVQPVA